MSDLIGRTEAVATVRSMLDAGRLVTLTGPGGVGKTRLAVEAASHVARTTPDGAWIVELAALDQTRCADTADSLAEVIAASLGVRDDATLALVLRGERADLPYRLAEALRAKELLLLLDNCEHVVEPVAKLAELLLRCAPGLRILATSREPLWLTGETVWPVSPLPVPDPPDPSAEGRLRPQPSAETPTPASLRSGAVQLFSARAAAAAPGFVLGPDNIDAVAAICRRLDGLPLALELAATRVRALGVHELAARLDDRFRLLAKGQRDAPARQRTLRALMDWSWELLSEAEQLVLRRLAVHADGCTLAAAEAVCGTDGVAETDVLDLLARLVDRSLVVVVGSASGTRYRLLETVAAYCYERLDEADEVSRTKRRHATWYADLAVPADARLRGHDQRQWLDRLDAETANIRTALDWALQQQDATLALRLVNATAWYWFLRGRHREAHRSLRRALAVAGDAPVAVRAQALAWLAGIGFLERPGPDPANSSRQALELYERVDDPGARAHAEWLMGFAKSGSVEMSASEPLVNEALETFRRLGDRWGVAAALSVRTSQTLMRGELAEARRHGEESRALFRELGDRWGQSRTADLLGVLAEIAGDYEQAARLHRDGLQMAEELGLWPVASQLLGRLGRLALLSADYSAADEFHERALRLAREQSFTPGITFAELGLGLVARRRGRLAAAEAHLRGVLEWHSSAGYEHGMALALAELGFVAEQRGDAEAARALQLDGLAAARATGDPRAIALALEGLAGAEGLAGRPGHAAQLLGTAAAARESVGSPLPPGERGDVDRISEAVRAGLGDVGFAAEFDLGRRTPLEDCLDALEEAHGR